MPANDGMLSPQASNISTDATVEGTPMPMLRSRRSSVVPIVEVANGTKLRGRVALVTGGTRGIGAAIVKSLAAQGCIVAAGYGGNKERAVQFQTEFQHEFPRSTISLHQGDIGNPDDCRRVVGEVVEQHGRIDILVNNAGLTIDKTVAKMTDLDWNRVISVNLSGAFFCSQEALKHMVEQGNGRIIFVSSVIGEIGNIGQSNYAASKSGLFGLTKTLAREANFMLEKAGLLQGNTVGVTVNCCAPGFIATEMVDHIPEKVKDRILSQIPCKRMGTPEEIARVIHFLAADASGYITGQVWGVNGGLGTCSPPS
ncbi:short-chain dehydrogenase/reductase SDR [Hyaloraphidium curvatum]|nr:short-chain dehydrogenase/reductase SDR [Hyaloraphidium curvatum]